MSKRAVLPDIGKLDQDPMSQVGYPTGVVGFHGLFGCKPLDRNRDLGQLNEWAWQASLWSQPRERPENAENEKSKLSIELEDSL